MKFLKSAFVLFFLFVIIVPSLKSQDVLDVKRILSKSGMKFASNRKINTIIIHSTFNDQGGDKYDINLIIKQFKKYKVNSNYVIGRDGTIYCLVKEKNIAFHAGESWLPNGKPCLNESSIGIELMTSYNEAPTPQQIKWLTVLVKDIIKRRNIEYVLRHSDIAPGRKTDPWNMDWKSFLKAIGRS